MPQGKAVSDYFNAPRVGERHIKIHVGERDIASDPRASLAANTRYSVLEGQGSAGAVQAAPCGRDVERTGGERPSLGQQQCAGCGTLTWLELDGASFGASDDSNFTEALKLLTIRTSLTLWSS